MSDPPGNVRAMNEVHQMGEQLSLAPKRAREPEPAGRVVVSDAFELLRSLDDESVDLVVTDPPYASLELHRSRGTTTRLTTNWFATVPDARLPELFALVYRVLRRDRHFYLFCDEVTADVIKQQQGIGAARQPNGGRRCSSGFIYWKEVIWAKTTLDKTRIRGGTGYHFRAACERILFFEKGKRTLADLGVPDVLLAPRSGVTGPAVKPGEIVRTLLLQSSSEGDLVVDPFAGSGVVGVEARASNRRFLLGDLDLAYLDSSLADVAPPGFSRAQPSEEEAREPPPLEGFEEGVLGPEESAAAHALGLLDQGAPTEALLSLLRIRPKEREAALRRLLRGGPPQAPSSSLAARTGAAEGAKGTGGAPRRTAEPQLLRAWRQWALSGKRL